MSFTRSTARALAALALLAAAGSAAAADVPLPPPPAGMQRLDASPARAGGWLSVAAGPWAAFDVGRSYAVTADYGFRAARQPFTRGELEWHLVVLGARPKETSDLYRSPGVPIPGFPPLPPELVGTAERSAFLVEVVPTARLRLPVAPGFALFADAGLGLGAALDREVEDEAFLGRSTTTALVLAPVLRLGAGLAWDASPRVRVVFHPIAFSAQLGADWSGFSPTLGLAFRL